MRTPEEKHSELIAGEFPEILRRRESLDEFLTRKIANTLDLPVETVRENLGKCRCCWSAEFRTRMDVVAAAHGNTQPSWSS
jgi:hypothetical protein